MKTPLRLQNGNSKKKVNKSCVDSNFLIHMSSQNLPSCDLSSRLQFLSLLLFDWLEPSDTSATRTCLPAVLFFSSTQRAISGTPSGKSLAASALVTFSNSFDKRRRFLERNT